MARENLLKLRRGTAQEWAAVNPTLDAGEPGFESDTKLFKIGDGSTSWNNLKYVGVDGGNLDASPVTTPTASATPTPTASATPTPTASATPTPTASATPTPTASATPTPTESATPTPAAFTFQVVPSGSGTNASRWRWQPGGGWVTVATAQTTVTASFGAGFTSNQSGDANAGICIRVLNSVGSVLQTVCAGCGSTGCDAFNSATRTFNPGDVLQIESGYNAGGAYSQLWIP